MNYRGFRVRVTLTGEWAAIRHGVGLSASTREQLYRVIDLHIQDREQWIAERKVGQQ
jgi:hypothetical protein